MTAGKPALLGALALLLCLPACTAAEPAEPQTQSAASDYTPPAGAPALCADLLRAGHFADIPPAVGRLVAGVDVVDARSRLAAARGELRSLASGLLPGEWPELRTAVDEMIDAMAGVLDPPVDDADRARLLAGVDQLVAQTQTVCEFSA
ncbi:hypothetical protein GCU60_16330 [Blastococcus saxobsidens]|uniref:Uncharacterized protein n=1 Tax=Blastococcus saxobsidens TaxID=138336 RepID=A0A6L9W7B2_9ACTN|nr:hypothetical protein [Blastococcus saxobsidens]NEK87311.1 hypothetical protein [Blastococcus saxobsidens]